LSRVPRSLAIHENSGRNLQIAYTFVSQRDVDIYETDLAGPDRGKPQPLIRTTSLDTDPRHSPDGTSLAYRSGRPYRNIWVADREGRNRRQLTDLPSRGSGPLTWSPDGRKIAGHFRLRDAADIYVVDVETREVTQVTDHVGDDLFPVWSLDGSRIHFYSGRSGRPARWSVPAEGGEATLEFGTGTSVFEISSDGRWVFYRDDGALLKMPWEAMDGNSESARPTQVLSSVDSTVFRTTNSGLYFVPGLRDGMLCVLDAVSGEVRELLPVRGRFSSVGPDESAIYTVSGRPPRIDLRLLESSP